MSHCESVEHHVMPVSSTFSFLKKTTAQPSRSFAFLKPISQKPCLLSDLPSVIQFKQLARRFAIGAAVGAVIQETEDPGGRQGPQGPKRKEAPFDWEDHIARCTDQEFQLRYRLSKPAFYELLDLLRADLLQKNLQNAKNSKHESCEELPLFN